MEYKKEYERWLSEKSLTDIERDELLSIKENETEIEDRFFAPLNFGTAGLRGILGMGINRMNVYTIRQATQGLCEVIKKLGKKTMKRGVAVCMDCRMMSDIFAREAASVLAGNGIPVYIFESLRPTPELSFALRALECIAGINITASHNPKEYNGYKVYWEDGAQLPPKEADAVLDEIRKIDLFSGAKKMDFDEAVRKGMITVMGEEVDEAFITHILACRINHNAIKEAGDDFKIVYTPFHGTGYKLVPEVFRRMGIKNVLTVPEQSIPDGNFPTVKSPNPENEEGFYIAKEIAKRENVDLIIGTDPDADRVGVIVRNREGEYVPISGNQMGVLLLDYIIGAKRKAGELTDKSYAVKTIVTTEMARKVCEVNNIKMYETFTGFKFIAGKVEEVGGEGFLLGYEESYGYLMGDYCRDKDAVTASMMIAEMAAHYRSRNMSLYDAMEELYEKYGSYAEKTINLVMPGVSGLSKMNALMKSLRETPPETFGGEKVLRVRDYLTGKTNRGEELPISGSNVIYFEMADGTRFIIRPSGTEPKIRVYILAEGEDRNMAEERVEKYIRAAKDFANI